jgi:hypothetical protein|nr:MAG TPA: Receptor recognition protein, Long tail, Helical sandwich, Tail fiber [Caudoviricetes sp.]
MFQITKESLEQKIASVSFSRKAIQEMAARIETLETEIKELKK